MFLKGLNRLRRFRIGFCFCLPRSLLSSFSDHLILVPLLTGKVVELLHLFALFLFVLPLFNFLILIISLSLQLVLLLDQLLLSRIQILLILISSPSHHSYLLNSLVLFFLKIPIVFLLPSFLSLNPLFSFLDGFFLLKFSLFLLFFPPPLKIILLLSLIFISFSSHSLLIS